MDSELDNTVATRLVVAFAKTVMISPPFAIKYFKQYSAYLDFQRLVK